ncbi:MAG: DUF4893 domain-containing protein [Sphingomonas fennica]
MRPARAGLCAALGLLGGCGGGGGARPAAGEAPPAREQAEDDWRTIATDDDRRRLRDWRQSWTAALARLAGDRRVVAEGALFRPDAALDGVTPPLGLYRCRVTKLGAKAKGLPEFTAYPAFSCRIAAGPAGTFSLTKLDGSQRPIGTLYPDGGRMVFLGTMVLGDERRAQPYGRDPERDMAGLFERIGPARWRLALPAPRWESLLDVFELVPAK